MPGWVSRTLVPHIKDAGMRVDGSGLRNMMDLLEGKNCANGELKRFEITGLTCGC